jgi:bifunctional DNase/RNase
VADLIRMVVNGVIVEGNRPVVLLQEEAGDRVLPIVIGPAEAMAISLQLQGEKPPRPLTHDLMRNMLATLKVTVGRVVIVSLVEDTYHALITMNAAEGDHQHEIDARPSDAIALALRAEAPIYVRDDLLDQVQEQRQGFVIDTPPTIH